MNDSLNPHNKYKDQSDYYGLENPYLNLFGVLVAISSVLIPLASVLFEEPRPLDLEVVPFYSIFKDGSKPNSSIPGEGNSKSGS
tara:strand:- start:13803 stop:14054 length:252 start_codon:yes stop_codon:yes gene_type:complete